MEKISFKLVDKLAQFEFVPSATLFPIDIHLATKKAICPLCFCKLYEMRGKPYFHCKSRKHKAKFIISASKVHQSTVKSNGASAF